MKSWFWLGCIAALVAGCQEQVGSGSAGKASAGGAAATAHAAWRTDFEAAKATARAEGKHVLLDFSGSDWCGWCIKLDDEVFSKPAFLEYAAENLVLVLADFPSDKSGQSARLQAANEKLAAAFGVKGFPTVFILDPSGTPIAQTGYQAGGPEAYVAHIKQLIAEAK